MKIVNFCAFFAFTTFLAFSAYAAPIRIVALGDSLTAGYGLGTTDSYPAQLQAALNAEGVMAVVENAGVSGDTTANGLARVANATAGEPKPRLVLVALGANDLLRGMDQVAMKKNLHDILAYLQQQKIPAMLIGIRIKMPLPLMFGSATDKIYKDLAKQFDVPLYPFFLDGVAMDPKLNLPDGIHPNKAGVAIMVENTLPEILDALEE